MKGARDVLGIQRPDEKRRVSVLASGAHPKESVELLVEAPLSVERHLLQPPQRGELTFTFDDGLDRVGAQGAYELILEISGADEEATRFKSRSIG